MEPHFHTGIVTFVTVGAYFLIWYNALRLLAIWLARNGHDLGASTLAGILPVSAPASN